jgi:hypothetical protein
MKIKIDGKNWKISYVNDISDEDYDGQKLEGLCDFEKQRIYISNITANRARLEVEIHELVHAIDHKLSHKKVTRLGHEISVILWKLGYRRTCKKKK